MDRNASHDLTFTHIPVGEVLRKSVTHTLTFVQDASTNIKTRDAVTEIAFVQDYSKIGPVNAEAITEFVFSHDISKGGSSQSLSVTTEIVFEQRPSRVIDVSATTTLTFSQGEAASFPISNTIEFEQDAAAYATTLVTTNVVFTQTPVAQGSYGRGTTTTLDIQQSCVAYTTRQLATLGCDYAPISGAMPSEPTLVRRDTIELAYPYAGPTLTLTLRYPNLGDNESKHYSRIVRDTRGGTLKTFRRSVWPKMTAYKYTITFNKHSEIVAFLDFVTTSFGKEIKLTDYLSRVWRGIIKIDNDQFAHASRANRQLTFNFEGALVP